MAQETATKARDLRNPLPWRNVTKRDLGIMFQFALPRGHGLSQKLVGIVFIGSPHRGSWTTNVGEIWRKLASFVLMDTNARILHSLCLKNSDLERCQDAFSALWLKYNFRVKTFQEGLPLKLSLRFGQSMMSKVVPDVSSCLGDTRERAEVLDGDHRPICRFSSCSDPNYQKLAAELIEIYDGIVHKVHVWPFDRTASQMTLQDTDPSPKTPIFNIAQKATLNFYAFPEMHFRRLSIDEPVQNTCMWLAKCSVFGPWTQDKDVDQHRGLIRLLGKPGSGKSTLMKRSFEHLRTDQQDACVVAHFSNRGGQGIEHSVEGMLRSVIYQLCY